MVGTEHEEERKNSAEGFLTRLYTITNDWPGVYSYT